MRWYPGWIPVCVLIWGLAVGAGLARLNDFANAPGLADKGLCQWPRDSLIQPSRSNSTLVMFIHERCPCSQASLAELARITAAFPDTLKVQVCVFRPGENRPVRGPSLWRDAAQIPGVTVMADPEGREAQKFGALTSGHTFLYGKNGSLLFSGGITAGRGHSGDNFGRAVVLALAADPQNTQFSGTHTCVFGCPLFISSQP